MRETKLTEHSQSTVLWLVEGEAQKVLPPDGYRIALKGEEPQDCIEASASQEVDLIKKISDDVTRTMPHTLKVRWFQPYEITVQFS